MVDSPKSPTLTVNKGTSGEEWEEEDDDEDDDEEMDDVTTVN